MISTLFYRWSFFLALIAVTVLSLAPLPSGQLFQWEDKIKHALAYGVLFYLSVQAYRHKRPLWILAAGLAVYGTLMEFFQSFSGYRYADYWDMLANILGIVIVWLAFYVTGHFTGKNS